MKIVRETKIVGFGKPTVVYVEPTEEEFRLYLQQNLGVQSWYDVPQDIRRNDRSTVGSLNGCFVFQNLNKSDDLTAVRHCLSEAIKQNSSRTEEFRI